MVLKFYFFLFGKNCINSLEALRFSCRSRPDRTSIASEDHLLYPIFALTVFIVFFLPLVFSAKTYEVLELQFDISVEF